jgi:hypothetical protein
MATLTLPTSTALASGQNYGVIQAGSLLEAGRCIRRGVDGLGYYATNSDITRSTVIGITISKAYAAGQWVVYALPSAILTISGATKGIQYYLDHGTDEVQTLTITGTPTGGTFSLSYNGTVVASAIAYNAASATLQTALETFFGVGNITVTGGAGGPYTVTFKLLYGAMDAALLVLSTNAFTGGTSPSMTIVETTAGLATGNLCVFADLVAGYAITPVLLATATTQGLLNPTYSGVVL